MIASGKDTEHLDFSYFVAVRVRCYRNTLAVSYTNMHIFSIWYNSCTLRHLLQRSESLHLHINF